MTSDFISLENFEGEWNLFLLLRVASEGAN